MLRRSSACIAILTLAACSGGSDDASDTSESAEVESSTPGNTGDPGASSDPDAPGGGESSLPGGTEGAELLREKNWLSPDGKLYFAETAPDDDVQEAICGYLFGTPEEIGDVALLTGPVTLAEGSGYGARGGFTGFICGYDVDAEDAFAMAVTGQEGGAFEEATDVVKVDLPNRLVAELAYAPGYAGATIDDATAQEWLTEAGERLSF